MSGKQCPTNVTKYFQAPFGSSIDFKICFGTMMIVIRMLNLFQTWRLGIS